MLLSKLKLFYECGVCAQCSYCTFELEFIKILIGIFVNIT